MGEKTIMVGSVTYAMKGKELLSASGIKAYVERTKSTKEFGCGYGVVVQKDADEAVGIMKENGIKVLAVTEK